MAPPPDDYGWAYLDAQRATASADGPSGSLQFRWGSEDLIPGRFSGSSDLVFYPNSIPHSHDSGGGSPESGNTDSQDMSGSALYLYGTLHVSGAISASHYAIREVTAVEIDVSGSTQFGDNYLQALPVHADHHERTGSMWVLGTDMQVAAPNPRLNIKSIDTSGTKTSQIFWNVPGASTSADDVQLANITAHITDKALQHISINAAATTANHLVVDSGTGYVGVNCTAPEARLEIVGPSEKQLKLRHDDDPATAGVFQWSDAAGMWCVSTGHAGQSPESYIDSQAKVEIFTEHFKIGGVAATYTSEGASEGGAAYGPDMRFDIAGGSNSIRIDWDDSAKRLNFDSTTLVVDTAANRIGIGESAPDKPLHITDNVPEIKLEDAQGGYAGVQASAGNLEFYADDGNAVSNSNIVFQIDNTEWARISHLGYVGINTNSPEAVLHVKDDAGVSMFERNNDTAANDANIRIRRSRGTKAGNDAPANISSGDALGTISWTPYYGDYNNVAASISVLSSGAGTDSTPAHMIFSTTPSSNNTVSERMRITSDGNVGIGLTSPNTRLEIRGDSEDQLKLHYKDSAAATGVLQWVDSSGMWCVKTGLAGGNAETYIDSNTTVHAYTEHLKIGGVSPNFGGDTKITIYGTSNNLPIYWDDSARTLAFDTSDLFIDAANAKVGIGETSPLGTLHVKSADSGITSVDAKGDELILESDGNAGLSILAGPIHVAGIYFPDSGDADLAYVKYDHGANAMAIRTNGSDAVHIDSSQKVGMGTSSPDSHLEVMGTGTQLKLSYNDTSTDNATFAVDDDGKLSVVVGGDIADIQAVSSINLKTAKVEIGKDDTTDVTVKLLGSTNDMTMVYDESANVLNVDSNTLVVDGANNHVGIGTADPDVALEVVDATAAQIKVTHDNTNYTFLSTNSAGNFIIQPYPTATAHIVMNAAAKIWNKTAEVVIGTGDTNDTKITFDGSTNDLSIEYDESAKTLAFDTSDLFIDAANASVGIGTATPNSEPDEKNDLVIGDHTGNRGMTIASTATGVGTIRFSPTTAANSGEGWIDYSNNTKRFRLGTDGLTTRMVVDSVGTQVTGTLEVSSDTVIGGTLLVADKIAHTGDSGDNTYIAFPSGDTIRVTTNGNEMFRFQTESGQLQNTHNNSSGDIDFVMKGDAQAPIGNDGNDDTIAFHMMANSADEGFSGTSTIHMSSALGPLTSSGGIHASNLVANDLKLSGTLSSIGYLNASNSILNPAGTFTLSGSSYAVKIIGGLSASHDIKAEHLYVNDLYISGTAHGIVVDRANYASSSTTTERTYSPVGLDTSGYLYVSGSSILGTAATNTHVVTGEVQVTGTLAVNADLEVGWLGKIVHRNDPNTYIKFYGDQIDLYAGGQRFLAADQTTQDVLSLNTDGSNIDLRVRGSGQGSGMNAIYVNADGDGEGMAANTPHTSFSGALGPITSSGCVHASDLVVNDAQISGSLILGSNGLLKMNDNTSAKILVADGTSYQEVAISGDVSISSAGAVTIAAGAVEGSMVNDDLISSKTNIAAVPAQTDEFLISDNGTLKAITFDQLENSVFASISGDATVAAGGALTVGVLGIDHLDIDGATDIGAALVGSDLIIVDDGAGGTNRKAALSRVATYTKTDVGTAGTVEANKAIITDASKNIASLGTVGCGAITTTGALSGSNAITIQGSASFGAPVDISGDLVFHAAAVAGVIDIKVNDGAGADTAIRIGKNGKVTKIGDDTPSDGQYLSWDAAAGKVAWADGLTVWGMSGSDAHYSSTELRTSGDLAVSGSVTLGGISAGTKADSSSYLVLDSNNAIVKTAAIATDSDGAEIAWGADSEVKLIHNHNAGLIIKRTATGNNNPTSLILQSGEESISGGDVIGRLQWQAPDESNGGNGASIAAQIECRASQSWNNTTQRSSLVFNTANNGTLTPWVELEYDGNLTGSNWEINAAGTGSFSEIDLWGRITSAMDSGNNTWMEMKGDYIAFHAGTTDQPQLTITQGEVVFNEGSSTRDFRIESNSDDHAFFIDGGDANAFCKIAGGYGSTGATISKTGSLAINNFLQVDGDITTHGDLTVCGNTIKSNTGNTVLSFNDAGEITNNISISGDPEMSTIAIASDIVHQGDSNTKISFADLDQIVFTAGGREFLSFVEDTQDVVRFNSANADVDYMFSTSPTSGSLVIEGDTGDIHMCGDTYTFEHESGEFRIRPNNSNQGKVIIHSRDTTATDEGQLQFLRYTDASMPSGCNLGLIQFKASEDEDGTYYTAASILAEIDESGWTDGSSAAGRLCFYTTGDGSTTGTERLRIDSSGYSWFYDDVVISSDTGAHLDLRSDSSEAGIRMYGNGDAMGDGDNIGSVRWYGTETDGTGNSAESARIVVETAEASWAYNSSLATMMKFGVGVDGSTTIDEVLYIDGASGAARVGINQSSPESPLHVYQALSDGHGAVKIEGGESTVDNYDTLLALKWNDDTTIGANNYWIKFTNETGVVGHINSEVAYGEFTGQHVTKVPTGTLRAGMILKSTGEVFYRRGISNAWVVTSTTTAEKDKAVAGVYDAIAIQASDSVIGEDLASYNAVGEGQILVTDTGGNIEVGDYICSSNNLGHGMLQDDDLLHNYTVAKANEAVDFSTVEVDAELGFKSVLVACTYHCG